MVVGNDELGLVRAVGELGAVIQAVRIDEFLDLGHRKGFLGRVLEGGRLVERVDLHVWVFHVACVGLLVDLGHCVGPLFLDGLGHVLGRVGLP